MSPKSSPSPDAVLYEKRPDGGFSSAEEGSNFAVDASPTYSVGDNNDSNESEINYHVLEWWQAGVVLVAETVSLGILSLPAVVATVGLVPGIILIVFMGLLSTYSGLVMGEFRKQYPTVENFGDALEILGNSIGQGRLFKEVFGWAQMIFQIFVMASHLLTWTICLNTLTDSSTCTIVWAVVGMIIFFVLNLPRTLKAAGYYAFFSFASVFIAVIITMIDVGIEKPIGDGSIDIARAIGFTNAFLAVTNIAVAFSGHSCFFSVMAEFKQPNDWPKALMLLQICDISLYIVVSIVIYYYVGPSVPSPALSAAGSITIRKVIWGIAIPTIVLAGVIYGHVAVKYFFGRIFKGTRHVSKNTKTGWFGWIAIAAGLWGIAFVIAESIPVFSNLLGLVAALFASWFSYGLPGMLWLWMNWGEWNKTPKKMAMCALNWLLVVVATVICVCGLWATGEAISQDKGNTPWSCKSNAAK